MDELPNYGPAFSQLTEKRKKFVLAMASDPFGNHNQWAIDAGYADTSEAAKVRAWELLQREDIKAAVSEVAKGSFATIGPMLATAVMLTEARNPDSPHRLKAAEMIANRVGLHETQEFHVKHTDLTGDALMARLAAVAERLGLDAQKLIGVNADSKLVEGSATEVKDGD